MALPEINQTDFPDLSELRQSADWTANLAMLSDSAWGPGDREFFASAIFTAILVEELLRGETFTTVVRKGEWVPVLVHMVDRIIMSSPNRSSFAKYFHSTIETMIADGDLIRHWEADLMYFVPTPQFASKVMSAHLTPTPRSTRDPWVQVLSDRPPTTLPAELSTEGVRPGGVAAFMQAPRVDVATLVGCRA